MGRIARAVALTCAVAGASIPVTAMSAQPAATPIADRGTTRLSGGSAGMPVTAVITTRRASADERGRGAVTRCSGGRMQCSLVDRLTLSVGKDQVDVPRRATLALADVNDGKLVRSAAGRYELILGGGDAAASYQARLFFDRRRVDRLEIWSSEAGKMEEATTYEDLSHAFL